jgi:hypothetical protein
LAQSAMLHVWAFPENRVNAEISLLLGMRFGRWPTRTLLGPYGINPATKGPSGANASRPNDHTTVLAPSFSSQTAS